MRRVFRFAFLTGLLLALAGVVRADAQIRTQVVVDGLASPVAFVPDPTSPSRFFIVQQGGLIRLWDGTSLTTFLDLTGAIRNPRGSEEGLLGMAFAPSAVTSGTFFVNFTSPDGDIVVSRFRRVPADAPTADPGTRFDLIWPGNTAYIPHPSNTNHNGGHLAFGPDGMLYIGTGDGGGSNDQPNNAQNSGSLLGKMLRIDVNVPDADPEGYDVPPDNPFMDANPIVALGEIWDFGLRNPWRYSFDTVGAGATGALIIADVGQGAREEVNYEPFNRGGRNYGWRILEGTRVNTDVPPTDPAFTPLTGPLFDYPRTIGGSITGGYVYRGTGLPAAYRGRYFVADYVSQIVGSIGFSVNGTTGEAAFVNAIDHTAELGSPGRVTSFGRDLQGELYLVTSNGRVLKLVAAEQPEAPVGLSALVSGRTVALEWTAPPAGVVPTGYRLEAGSTPGGANLATFATGVTPELTVAGVADGVYYVRVRAERNGIVGPPSNEVQVTVDACGIVAAPTSFSFTRTGQRVTMTWNTVANAAGYLVLAGNGPGQSNLASLPTSGAPLIVDGVPSGTYYVRVHALNGCGIAGAASNEITVVVP
ncbi:MAG: PQQ-dependent sugar dehydrogenase [Acidobacteria bacterium]|nr:PQQ-dependent sugar dehydrogenase [Acidobacteriota bacterium]